MIVRLPDGSMLVLANKEDDTSEQVPETPPAQWKGPGQWRSYADAVQEGEPEDEDDDPDDIGLASVSPYTRVRRGRVQKVRGYHSRAERALLNGWIPEPKWKQGQETWAVRGEDIWRANEWKPRPASALKIGDQVQVAHPVTGSQVQGTVKAVNKEADGSLRLDVEHPEQVPRPYQLNNGPTSTPPKRHRREITEDQARGNSRPVSSADFQHLAALGNRMVDQMKRGASPVTGLDDHWDLVKDEAYAAAQQPWGGVTVDSHTGENIPDGADEYAMSVKPARMKTVSVPEDAGRDEFNAAMDKALGEFRPVLERKGYHLGVFHDDENHRIDIDPVAVVDSPYKVEAIGAYAHSIGGAYHFATGNGYYPPHVDPAAEQHAMERSVVTLHRGQRVPARDAPAEQEPLAVPSPLVTRPDTPVPAPADLVAAVDKLYDKFPDEGDNSVWRWNLAKDGGPAQETMRRNEVVRQAGKLIDAELQKRVAASVAAHGDVQQQIKDLSAQVAQAEVARRTAHRKLTGPDAVAAGFPTMDALGDRLVALSKAYDDYVADGSKDPSALENMTGDQLKAEITRLATAQAASSYKAGQDPQVAQLAQRKTDMQVQLLQLRHLAQTAQRDEAVKLLEEVRGDEFGGRGLNYRGRTKVDEPEPGALAAMRWAESNYPQAWLEYARQHGGPGGYALTGGVPRGDYTDVSRQIRLSEAKQEVTGAGKSGRVAVHELGHAMEQSVPGLVPMQQAEIWRRTATGDVGSRTIEDPQPLDGYTNEKARPDKFPLPYSGKDYAEEGEKTTDAYELFSTGAESLFAGSPYLDDDFRQWMLGAMAMLGRGSAPQLRRLSLRLDEEAAAAEKNPGRGGAAASHMLHQAAAKVRDGDLAGAATDIREAAKMPSLFYGLLAHQWSELAGQAEQLGGVARPDAGTIAASDQLSADVRDVADRLKQGNTGSAAQFSLYRAADEIRDGKYDQAVKDLREAQAFSPDKNWKRAVKALTTRAKRMAVAEKEPAPRTLSTEQEAVQAERGPYELRPDEGTVPEPSAQDIAAIKRAWYGPPFKYTNADLRAGRNPGADAAVLSRLIAAASPMEAPVQMYRGVQQADQLFGETGSRVGRQFTDRGFVSLSPDENVFNYFGAGSEDFRQPGAANIVVHVPAGTRALKANPEWAPDIGPEVQEYTLQAGTTFEVTADAVLDGRRVIEVAPVTEGTVLGG